MSRELDLFMLNSSYSYILSCCAYSAIEGWGKVFYVPKDCTKLTAALAKADAPTTTAAPMIVQ